MIASEKIIFASQKHAQATTEKIWKEKGKAERGRFIEKNPSPQRMEIAIAQFAADWTTPRQRFTAETVLIEA